MKWSLISRQQNKNVLNVKQSLMLFHHDKFNFISVFRLWAEVFHVSASGAGTVKWQQVSEDLVPVNITCIQDSPECVFHITAYNSQVDKILDVRLVQPGMLSEIYCNYKLNGKYFDFLFFRNTNWSSIRMFCVLERSHDEWHMGLKFYIANWCQTI